MDEYVLMFNTKNDKYGDITPIRVKPRKQERQRKLLPIIVYKSVDSGMTYSGKYVKSWDDLTAEQKKKVYRGEYRKTMLGARLELSKCPDLRECFDDWKSHNKEIRDIALQRIDAGETVDFVPFYLW